MTEKESKKKDHNGSSEIDSFKKSNFNENYNENNLKFNNFDKDTSEDCNIKYLKNLTKDCNGKININETLRKEEMSDALFESTTN